MLISRVFSASRLLTWVLKVGIAAAESIKGKRCGQCSRAMIWAFRIDGRAGLRCWFVLKTKRVWFFFWRVWGVASQGVFAFHLWQIPCESYRLFDAIRLRFQLGRLQKLPSYSTFLSFSCQRRRTEHSWNVRRVTGKAWAWAARECLSKHFLGSKLIHSVPAERRGILGGCFS